MKLKFYYHLLWPEVLKENAPLRYRWYRIRELFWITVGELISALYDPIRKIQMFCLDRRLKLKP